MSYEALPMCDYPSVEQSINLKLFTTYKVVIPCQGNCHIQALKITEMSKI
jgi:hypothetical protein